MSNQILVSGGIGSQLIQVSKDWRWLDVALEIERRSNLPLSCIRLRKGSRLLKDNDFILNEYNNNIFITSSDSNHINRNDFFPIELTLNNILIGGKGGFGAALRIDARKQGKKGATIDFGACRDLNGRRLRHINDEILLKKWNASQNDGGKSFQVNEPTNSGINMWYMGVPNWGKGTNIKKSISQQELHFQRESHLIDKSKGEQIATQNKKRQLYLEEQSQYVRLIDDYVDENDVMQQLINEGLRNRKKRRFTDSSGSGSSSSSSSSSSSQSIIEQSSSSSSSKDLKEAEDFTLLIGEGLVLPNGTIQCNGSFATFGFHEASITESSLKFSENNNINFHYEVEIHTEGLFQIGWASKAFINQINNDGSHNSNYLANDDDLNNGVGDDEYSWSFDGARAYRWHGKNAEPKSYGCKWKKGDIIGCDLVVISSGGGILLKYTLNGNDLGIAFTLEEFPVGGLFPAISLEHNEYASVNFGQYAFKFGTLRNKSIADILQMKSHISSDAALDVSLPLKPKKILETPEEENDNKDNLEITIELESEELKDLDSLLKFGDERIKTDLIRRGLKSGGTALERAQRLFSIRGLASDMIPNKLKKKVVT